MTTTLSVSCNGDAQVEEPMETAGHDSLIAATIHVSVKGDGHDTVARVDVAVDCGVANPNRARNPTDGVIVLNVRAAYYTITPA